MADLTSGGNPVDERALQLKQRRIEYEIHGMQVTIEKYEIDILVAEDNIVRLHESIEATKTRIQEKMKEKESYDG